MFERAPHQPASPSMLHLALPLVLALVLVVPGPAGAAPEGQLTWAFHVSMAPTAGSGLEIRHVRLAGTMGWRVITRLTVA